jgi:hypothetical protein
MYETFSSRLKDLSRGAEKLFPSKQASNYYFIRYFLRPDAMCI